ncbi:hypothetical protein GCM10023318_33570 [Nocardia callitridis]|uniref:Uncharacterized protein n=2 Tax=Nocardia callitridis TaxID=648753 RepID=A0ABP9KHR6_9NOCA
MKAIGVINVGRSTDWPGDERIIRDHAAACGHELVGILEFGEATFMPTTLVVYTAFTRGAQVIITPTLDHIGAAAQAISQVRTVETPTQTLSCIDAR